MRNKALIGLGFILVIGMLSCSGNKDYLARVNQAKLKEHDMVALHSSVQLSPALREKLIQDWVDQEALYHAALKAGIDKDQAFVTQMEKLRREILVQKFIDNDLEQSVTISTSEIERYYSEHPGEFIYPDDHIRVQYFWTKNRNKIRDISVKFATMSRLRKRDFMEIIAPTADDSDRVGTTPYLTRDKFDERVSKQLFSKTAIDEIIGPVQLSNGYFALWYVIENLPKNSQVPLSEVADDIEARLRTLKRKARTAELVEKARKESEIEYGERKP